MGGRREDTEPIPKPWLKSYDNGVPAHIDYPRTTLPACLEESAARYPDRAAIVFLGRSITYGILQQLVDRFAASLQQVGISRGDRVAISLPNSPPYIIAYYGTLKAGAIVVPANPMYVERELLHLLKDSGARTVITLDSKASLGKVNAVRKSAGLRNVIIASLRNYLPPLRDMLSPRVQREQAAAPLTERGTIGMRDMLLGRHGTGTVGPEVKHDDIAVTVYTGGTTGVPKGVCLTHDNLLANVLQCQRWLLDVERGSEISLTVLPVFHAFSMTTAMNRPICAGETIILLPKFEPASVLEAIDKRRPALLTGVPAIFHAIVHHPDLHRYDLSSLRLCVSGADALPSGIRQEFERVTGCKLIEGYGLNEASPVVTCNPVYGKSKGIGLPLPDTDCRIIDPDSGVPCLPGEDGELIVRGPQVMPEYCNNPEETATALKDGWLYTGDIVRMDEDGYFEFVGRKKDLIKVQRTDYITAYKVYASEIEEILLKHRKVQEAAAIGVPDPLQGERVVAYVVLRPGSQVSADELARFCRRYLAEYKVPSQIEYVDALPKNVLGKVLRNELRQRSSPAPPETESPSSPFRSSEGERGQA